MHVHKDFPFLIVEETKEPLRESLQTNHLVEGLGLTTTGKLFLAGMGAYILGRASKLKIKGTKKEISAIANALKASKRFQDELKKPGSSVKSVMQKLNVKNLRGKAFERVLGIKWPL